MAEVVFPIPPAHEIWGCRCLYLCSGGYGGPHLPHLPHLVSGVLRRDVDALRQDVRE